MRPRRFTADNILVIQLLNQRNLSFNEAAAFHRGQLKGPPKAKGKRRGPSMRPRRFTADNVDVEVGQDHASDPSMRPRRFTADNTTWQWLRLLRRRSFNEAAAFHRGQPAR